MQRMQPVAFAYMTSCRGRSFVALVLTVASFTFVPSTATASTPLASYVTPSCGAGVTWRIGYRLYWQDTSGTTLPRDVLPEVLTNAREFTEKVGVLSSCGVRIQIDVYDQGAEKWPTSPRTRDVFPAGTNAFRTSRNYDAIFARHPAVAGLADDIGGYAFYRNWRVRFAMPAQSDPNGVVASDPWELFLMHEWLHLVVRYYTTPRLRWPYADVHGACLHGHTERCNVNEPYFGDMLNGRVNEAGQLRGLQPDEWARYGTPTQPSNRDPGLELTVRGKSVSMAWEYHVGAVVVTYTNRRGTVVFRERTTNLYTIRPRIKRGLYRVCLRNETTNGFTQRKLCRPYRA